MEMACSEAWTSAWLSHVRIHVRSINRPKLRSVLGGLAKECDINIPKTMCIDSSHKAVQVFASSLIFEAPESKENNASLCVWRQAYEVSVG